MQEGQQNHPLQFQGFLSLQGYQGLNNSIQQQTRSMSFQATQEYEMQPFNGRSERLGSHHEYLQNAFQSPHPQTQFQSQHQLMSQFQQFQLRDYQLQHQNILLTQQNASIYQNFQAQQASPLPGFQSYQPNKIIEQTEFLTVTVIPLEAHLNPFEMQVEMNPEVDKNLKQIFANQKYWGPIFQKHSPLIPPHFRVFKTTVSDYQQKFPYFKGLKLQILSLKCEGYQFPKNPNALPIEQFCKQHFFGPLVVSLQTETAPPVLKHFIPSFLENLRSINEEEGRNYPAPPIPSILNNPQFLPTTGQINGISQQIDILTMSFNLQKISEESMNETFQKRLELYLKNINPIIFYIYRYKTSFCANKSKDHDWNHCVYAHKPFDYRRPPDKYYYLPEKCKNYNQETGQGCNDQCQFSHTTFERLYHPFQYKTNPCQQYGKKRKTCQKGELCAFVHYDFELRHIPSCDKLFLFERIKKSVTAMIPLQNELNLPSLPEMTDEELRHLQRITEQQQSFKLDTISLSQSDSSQNLSNQPIIDSLNSNSEISKQDLIQASMNVKSKAFTPSYKKGSSYSGNQNNYGMLEIQNNSQRKIQELEIDDLRFVNIENPMPQPKSPLRHQSSSQTNLHQSESLIVNSSLPGSCKQQNNEEDQESEMLNVLLKSKNFIKIHEETQTRTSSRFQHIFDKIAHSDNASRKGTENSNQQSLEGEAEGGLAHSSDAGQKDIFSMNIEINYLKDQHSDF